MPDLPPPDYDQLKALLDGDQSMTVGQAMGAFVAVHSMPTQIPAARWLPAVMRRRAPAEVSPAALSALLDLYELVGAQLEEEGMLLPDAEDPNAVRAFCSRCHGSALHEHGDLQGPSLEACRHAVAVRDELRARGVVPADHTALPPTWDRVDADGQHQRRAPSDGKRRPAALRIIE